MPSSENYSRRVKTARRRHRLTIHCSFVHLLRCHFARPFRNIPSSKRCTSPEERILFREWNASVTIIFLSVNAPKVENDVKYFYCGAGFKCSYYIVIVRLFSFFKSDLSNGSAFKWGL